MKTMKLCGLAMIMTAICIFVAPQSADAQCPASGLCPVYTLVSNVPAPFMYTINFGPFVTVNGILFPGQTAVVVNPIAGTPCLDPIVIPTFITCGPVIVPNNCLPTPTGCPGRFITYCGCTITFS